MVKLYGKCSLAVTSSEYRNSVYYSGYFSTCFPWISVIWNLRKIVKQIKSFSFPKILINSTWRIILISAFFILTYKECSFNLVFQLPLVLVCISLAPSSSSSLPVNIWCAEINNRIPSFFEACRWSTILAKDFFKCLSSHDTHCVWQDSSSSCRDTMFSEDLLLYLSKFSCIFIQQSIAASFVVSCPLWVKSCLREDFCLKNCCSFQLGMHYASLHLW